MGKIWKYVYIDQMETTTEDGITMRSAVNRSLFSNCPISYNVPEGLCYIHSDEEIEGLTLLITNSEMISSIMGS